MNELAKSDAPLYQSSDWIRSAIDLPTVSLRMPQSSRLWYREVSLTSVATNEAHDADEVSNDLPSCTRYSPKLSAVRREFLHSPPDCDFTGGGGHS